MIFKLVSVDVEEWKYSFTRNVLIFWVDYIKLFDKKGKILLRYEDSVMF